MNLLITVCQVVPGKMADNLFEACQSDSYEKLDSTVKVRNLYIPQVTDIMVFKIINQAGLTRNACHFINIYLFKINMLAQIQLINT